MKSKILGIILTLLFLIGVFSAMALAAPITKGDTIPTTTISEDYIPSETESTQMVPATTEPLYDPLPEDLGQNLVYIEGLTQKENIDYRILIANKIADLFTLAASLDLADPDYLDKSNALTSEIKRLQALDNKYLEDYLAEEERLKWAAKAEKYPVATEVWLYLTDILGYSDHVAAGIIGNMMGECGGLTLNLQWWRYNSTNHYGLCQWSPKYYPQMQGATLQQQLEFLGTSIPETFNGWAGKEYKINYEEFLALTDCKEVAKYFNYVYERPGGYDSRRGEWAQEAYDYFTS